MNFTVLRRNCRKLFILVAACLMLGLFTPVLAIAAPVTPSTTPSATSSVATASEASASKAATSQAMKSDGTTSQATKSDGTTSQATKSDVATSQATKSQATSSQDNNSDAATSEATTTNATVSNATISDATTSNATTSDATASESGTVESDPITTTALRTYNYVTARNSGSSYSYSGSSGSSGSSYSSPSLPAAVTQIIPSGVTYADPVPTETQAVTQKAAKPLDTSKIKIPAQTVSNEFEAAEADETPESEGSTVHIMQDESRKLADNESEPESGEAADMSEGTITMQKDFTKLIIIIATVLVCAGIAATTILFVRRKTGKTE